MRPRPAFLLSASRPPPSKPKPRPAYSPPPLSPQPHRNETPTHVFDRDRPPQSPVQRTSRPTQRPRPPSQQARHPSPIAPRPPRTSASTTAPGDAAGRITNNGQEATNAHPDGRGRARARTKAMGSVDHIFCFPLDNAPWSHLPCCARTGGDSGVPRFTAPSVVP